MNKLTTSILVPISCLALLIASNDSNAQVDGDSLDMNQLYGKPWTVTTTTVPPEENLIRVNDTMRLRKLPNGHKYILRPEPLLLGRWGGEANYFAQLDQSNNDARVYCGTIKVLRNGIQIMHELALSEVRTVPVIDSKGEVEKVVTDVSLYFYGAHPGATQQANNGCTFHDIHGGLAHVHRTD